MRGGGGGGSGGGRFEEGLWLCHVCEEAPATVTCKADAAALCAACDADIHSANPLAHRHERVPIIQQPPFSAARTAVSDDLDDFLIPLNNPCLINPRVMEDIDAGDPFLDFECDFSTNNKLVDHGSFSSCNASDDTAAPVGVKQQPPPVTCNVAGSCFQINFGSYEISPLKIYTQNVSSSSEIVTEENSAISETSNMVSDLSGSGLVTTRRSNRSDREAKVLRYREKKKNRKFQKTVRYASRKAYAESRPRIKGRFVKRTRTESETQHVYEFDSDPFGVVPTL